MLNTCVLRETVSNDPEKVGDSKRGKDQSLMERTVRAATRTRRTHLDECRLEKILKAACKDDMRRELNTLPSGDKRKGALLELVLRELRIRNIDPEGVKNLARDINLQGSSSQSSIEWPEETQKLVVEYDSGNNEVKVIQNENNSFCISDLSAKASGETENESLCISDLSAKAGGDPRTSSSTTSKPHPMKEQNQADESDRGSDTSGTYNDENWYGADNLSPDFTAYDYSAEYERKLEEDMKANGNWENFQKELEEMDKLAVGDQNQIKYTENPSEGKVEEIEQVIEGASTVGDNATVEYADDPVTMAHAQQPTEEGGLLKNNDREGDKDERSNPKSADNGAMMLQRRVGVAEAWEQQARGKSATRELVPRRKLQHDSGKGTNDLSAISGELDAADVDSTTLRLSEVPFGTAAVEKETPQSNNLGVVDMKVAGVGVVGRLAEGKNEQAAEDAEHGESAVGVEDQKSEAAQSNHLEEEGSLPVKQNVWKTEQTKKRPDPSTASIEAQSAQRRTGVVEIREQRTLGRSSTQAVTPRVTLRHDSGKGTNDLSAISGELDAADVDSTALRLSEVPFGTAAVEKETPQSNNLGVVDMKVAGVGVVGRLAEGKNEQAAEDAEHGESAVGVEDQKSEAAQSNHLEEEGSLPVKQNVWKTEQTKKRPDPSTASIKAQNAQRRMGGVENREQRTLGRSSTQAGTPRVTLRHNTGEGTNNLSAISGELDAADRVSTAIRMSKTQGVTVLLKRPQTPEMGKEMMLVDESESPLCVVSIKQWKVEKKTKLHHKTVPSNDAIVWIKFDDINQKTLTAYPMLKAWSKEFGHGDELPAHFPKERLVPKVGQDGQWWDDEIPRDLKNLNGCTVSEAKMNRLPQLRSIPESVKDWSKYLAPDEIIVVESSYLFNDPNDESELVGAHQVYLVGKVESISEDGLTITIRWRQDCGFVESASSSVKIGDKKCVDKVRFVYCSHIKHAEIKHESNWSIAKCVAESKTENAWRKELQRCENEEYFNQIVQASKVKKITENERKQIRQAVLLVGLRVRKSLWEVAGMRPWSQCENLSEAKLSTEPVWAHRLEREVTQILKSTCVGYPRSCPKTKKTKCLSATPTRVEKVIQIVRFLAEKLLVPARNAKRNNTKVKECVALSKKNQKRSSDDDGRAKQGKQRRPPSPVDAQEPSSQEVWTKVMGLLKDAPMGNDGMMTAIAKSLKTICDEINKASKKRDAELRNVRAELKESNKTISELKAKVQVLMKDKECLDRQLNKDKLSMAQIPLTMDLKGNGEVNFEVRKVSALTSSCMYRCIALVTEQLKNPHALKFKKRVKASEKAMKLARREVALWGLRKSEDRSWFERAGISTRYDINNNRNYKNVEDWAKSVAQGPIFTSAEEAELSLATEYLGVEFKIVRERKVDNKTESVRHDSTWPEGNNDTHPVVVLKLTETTDEAGQISGHYDLMGARKNDGPFQYLLSSSDPAITNLMRAAAKPKPKPKKLSFEEVRKQRGTEAAVMLMRKEFERADRDAAQSERNESSSDTSECKAQEQKHVSQGVAKKNDPLLKGWDSPEKKDNKKRSYANVLRGTGIGKRKTGLVEEKKSSATLRRKSRDQSRNKNQFRIARSRRSKKKPPKDVIDRMPEENQLTTMVVFGVTSTKEALWQIRGVDKSAMELIDEKECFKFGFSKVVGIVAKSQKAKSELKKRIQYFNNNDLRCESFRPREARHTRQ